jgi:hypothetical protein
MLVSNSLTLPRTSTPVRECSLARELSIVRKSYLWYGECPWSPVASETFFDCWMNCVQAAMWAKCAAYGCTLTKLGGGWLWRRKRQQSQCRVLAVVSTKPD